MDENNLICEWLSMRRVIRLPLGGLDRVTSRGLDGSTSRICTVDGCLARAGGTKEPALTTPSLNDPCLAFLWPQRLGRFSISTVLDKSSISLHQMDEVGSGLPLPPGRLSRLPNPSFCSLSWLPSIQEENLLEPRQINSSRRNEINNLCLRVVSSWVNTSLVGSDLSPQVTRRRRATKEWKVLFAKERTCWMRSR